MPPYVTVETYLPCPQDALRPIVGRYVRVLVGLGYDCAESGLLTMEMGWDTDDAWFGPVLDPARPVRGLSWAGTALQARAGVSGWSAATIPQLRDRWLSLELAFETECDEQYLVTDSVFAPEPGMYLPGVGQCLWQVMGTFAAEFKDTPIYCSFEGWEGNAWQALEAGGDDLWSFDAALVPPAVAGRFSPLSDEFVMERTPLGIALARRKYWPQLPWHELP